ncbi:MAG: AraC family transcriptional regulator [Bacteroidetes bacterium]|nr:AraC family transcriptional regulator [Bacteroidota bacterium]
MEPIVLSEGKYFGRLDNERELHFARLSLTSYGPDDTFHKHYHENSYLSLLSSGAYTENHKSNTRILNNGELIFRPAAYDHANDFCGNPGVCFNIEFKKDWQETLDYKFRLPNQSEIYTCGTFPEIYKAVIGFKNNNHSSDLSELLLQWLFETNRPQLPESNLHWIPKVKTILENETDVHHSINSISGRIHVHPIYLAGCFKKKTGFTIGEYQLAAKLKKAARLLLNTNMQMTEIALECGFYDAAHFSRHYTAYYSVSPLQFRKKLNK